MARLMLHKLVCVPVKGEGGCVTGVIYADAKRSTLTDSNIALHKPVLWILAKMLALRLSDM